MKHFAVIFALAFATFANAQQTKSSDKNKCDIDVACSELGNINASIQGYDDAFFHGIYYKIDPTEHDLEEAILKKEAENFSQDYIQAYACGYELAINCEGQKYSRSEPSNKPSARQNPSSTPKIERRKDN